MIFHRKLSEAVFYGLQNLRWHYPASANEIYLTFDDGPHPEVTSFILSMLGDFRIKATFFLSGEMIFKHRHHLGHLNYSGHELGNHGYFHRAHMLMNIKKIEHEIAFTNFLIKKYFYRDIKLFRPPFGIFSPALLQSVQRSKKEMIMWSVMSNDFKWGKEKVIQHLKHHIRSGDIVVFHDSVKSSKTTLEVLPDFLTFCQQKKLIFSQL